MIGEPSHNGSDILAGLANVRNAAGADHAAWPGIVSGKRFFQIAIKPVELFAQVTRPALKVLHRIIWIKT